MCEQQVGYRAAGEMPGWASLALLELSCRDLQVPGSKGITIFQPLPLPLQPALSKATSLNYG